MQIGLFCKNKSKKDGLHAECKICTKNRADSRKEYKSAYDKEYAKINCNKIAEKSRTFRLKNKEILYAKKLSYIAHKEAVSVEFKLARRLRSRLYKAVKGITKNTSAVRDLGCSVEFLKNHLESKFQPGMTWENYGKWHIDHIVPLASVNDINKLEDLCHYGNLQPLWAQDNLKKGKRVA